MKNILIIIIFLSVFTFLSHAQDYDNAGMDYTKAIYENATPAARIAALKDYIKTYPDTTNKFVRLAYYQLALNYFENKDYASAVSTGEKTFKLGSIGTGEEARLNLILANSYAIKSYSGYDKDKALTHINKAIALGNEANDNDVISTAKKLKSSLSGPPPKKQSPEQKIKMHYSDEDFNTAISYYNSLGSSDKANTEIKKIYAYSLFKAKKYDTAISVFEELLAADQKGVYSKYLGDIYSAKAGVSSKYHDTAAQFYLEASVLYKNEGSSSNQKIAAGMAKVELEDKYDYKSKYNKYQNDIKKQESASQQNERAIRDAQKAVRDFQRYLRKTYRDIQAPQYEYDKLAKLEAKAAQAAAGGSSSASASASGQDLLDLRKKIDAEYDRMLNEAEKKFGRK